MRQDLITRDQNSVLLAIERRMLGRMSFRCNHSPLTPSHCDEIPVTYPRELSGWPQAKVGLLTLRSRDCRGIIIRRAISFQKGDKLLTKPLLALVPHQPPAEPFSKRQTHHAV